MTKHSIASLALFLSLTVACGKKDGDNPAPAPAPAAAPGSAAAPVPPPAPPAPPPAADKPPEPAKPAAELPPECKEFTAAWDLLEKCDKIKPEQRTHMKDGYQKMLKAMQDLNNPKASADGCKQGLSGLKSALKTFGC